MISNILVGVLGVLAVAAGCWGWWVENGGSFGREKENKKESKVSGGSP